MGAGLARWTIWLVGDDVVGVGLVTARCGGVGEDVTAGQQPGVVLEPFGVLVGVHPGAVGEVEDRLALLPKAVHAPRGEVKDDF